MHVYCDLFDVLDIAERNEDLLQLKLSSPFVKGKWHMKYLLFLDYAFSGFISICMFRTY